MSFDAWYGDPSFGHEYEREEDYYTQQEQREFYNADSVMKDLIHHIYFTGDLEEIESALEELAYLWNYTLPPKEMAIQPKGVTHE